MIRKNENKKQGLNQNFSNFKHYKVMVKILHEQQVEYQNLEIFTTGLQQLLEMRRIHNKAFQAPEPGVLENLRSN
jgi:hypothetical protein